eukprot:scaffold674_cov119-Isochrysis_galbana.AAC.1
MGYVLCCAMNMRFAMNGVCAVNRRCAMYRPAPERVSHPVDKEDKPALVGAQQVSGAEPGVAPSRYVADQAAGGSSPVCVSGEVARGVALVHLAQELSGLASSSPPAAAASPCARRTSLTGYNGASSGEMKPTAPGSFSVLARLAFPSVEA